VPCPGASAPGTVLLPLLGRLQALRRPPTLESAVGRHPRPRRRGQHGAGPDPAGGQLLFGGVLGDPVRLFDLVGSVAGDRHQVVAGDGERADLPAAGGDVEQDQGVGVVAALVTVAGVQLIQDGLGERVAVLIPTGVQPDQQNVGRPVGLMRPPRPERRPAAEFPHRDPARPGSQEHHRRDHRERHPTHSHPPPTSTGPPGGGRGEWPRRGRGLGWRQPRVRGWRSPGRARPRR